MRRSQPQSPVSQATLLGGTLALVWSVGVRDYFLTCWMMIDDGTHGELNAAACYLVSRYGLDALLWLKLAGLVVYTLALLSGWRRPALSGLTAAAGVAASVSLIAWWDFVLLARLGGVE